MSLSTTTVSRVRWSSLALAFGVLVLLVLTLAAPALAAQRPDYTGGPIASNADGKADYPLYVPNDYTVCALRFSVTGGTLYDKDNVLVTGAGVQYYVKIRLSPTPAPASTDNRGFTWNPTTQAWVQEREDWTNFPVVTTTTGGAIAATSTSWTYFRFGDTTKAGTYYILISLQPVGGGSGTTQNNASPPAVTVLDTAGTIPGAADGFVIHNGVATGNAGKRAEATDAAAATTVWALTRTYTSAAPTMPSQLMPDMWTGANAASGDFALGVPAASAFDARIQNTIWPASASSFTGSLADVNIALGAAETTPPSAPASLTGKPRDGKAILTWGAATDNTAVTSYIVYRWTDPATGGYTALPQVVTTTSDLTYTDTGLTNDTTYHYVVRAEDAATNVGPQSATVDVTPNATPPAPVTSFQATAGDQEVHLSWTNPADADFAGVKVVRKEGSLPADPTDGTQVYDGTGTNAQDEGLTNGTAYYYAAFAYDTALNYATAATASDIVPSGATTITLSATPTVIDWGKSWQLSGQLKNVDGDAIPDAPVDLQASLDGGATWATLQGETPATGTSTYSDSISGTYQKMQYRLYYAGDATHTSSTSDAVTVTPRVKLGTPAAPASVGKGNKFTVSGSLTPQQKAGSKTIQIKCYLKKNGKWSLKKTVTATNSDKGSATKYSAKFSLPTKGSWKLVAYSAATSLYAKTTSGNEFLKVK